MNETIVQRRGFLRIEAELLPNGVRYSERGFLRRHDSFVPYEEIPDQVLRFWNPSRVFLAICAFFIALLLYQVYDFHFHGSVSMRSLGLTSFWLALACFGTWMRSPRYVGYYARGSGVLFFDRKGSTNPEEFMKRLQEARITYLRKRYGQAQEIAPHSGFRNDAQSSSQAPGRLH